MATLRDEIQQRAPFPNLETEAFLSVWRTADGLIRGVAEELKRADLTPAQYNALRILRGTGKGGLCCGEVGERMISQDPDVTRLLDRMEKRGLIRRERETADRRVVRVWITPRGARLVNSLDEAMSRLHARQLGFLGKRQLRELIHTLAQIREQQG